MTGCAHGEGGAKYKTPLLSEGTAMEMLKMHRADHHAPQGQAQGGAANHVKPEKYTRPVLAKGIGEDKYNLYLSNWSRYKRSTGLVDDTTVRDQLVGTCSTELYEDLYNLLGSSIDQKTELELLTEMKRLAVVSQNNMVNVVRLVSITQDRDEPIRSYLAKLKGASSVCKLTVMCTCAPSTRVSYADQLVLHCMVKGLCDEDIRAQVLGCTEEMGLEETVKFIEVKEAGKKAGSYLDDAGSLGAGVNRITGYKKTQQQELQAEGDKNSQEKCRFCGKRGHGAAPNFAKKKEECPAFDKNCNTCSEKGHFARSKACKKKASTNSVEVKHEKGSWSEAGLNTVVMKEGGKVLEQKLSRHKPVPHMREVAGKMVVAMPEEHPQVNVDVQVDLAEYKEQGLVIDLCRTFRKKNGSNLPPPRVAMLCDTGAQVDCVGVATMKKLGLTENMLLRPGVSLGCANDTGADVIGVFFGLVMAKYRDKQVKSKVLFYVLEKGKCLLSRSTCKVLGIIERDFPQVGRYAKGVGVCAALCTQLGGDVQAQGYQPVGECDPDSVLPCQCPRREFVDPPENCPIEMKVENRAELEAWILKYYDRGAFNGCRRQTMPCTDGPPMKIHTAPDAIPVVVHKPCPVPLHWREQVKRDIEADVKRGVLEKIPPGVPVTWCTRLVITPKKDGRPRRTVDLSGLTKVGIRETHHTRSPFKVVCTVPHNMLKSTLDCVDGYHGVPLAEEDRHKTTFLTEWGRYRYARAPQGYGSSNDGYTLRTDEVLAKIPGAPERVDYEKIVDDVITWSPRMEGAFKRICAMLSHCGKAGMVFSPKKFQFAMEEVEYAGFLIGKDSVQPTPKYLQSIQDFPVPVNISDIRSWFGLINQVAYCFSKGTIMAPFRELLKPSTVFEWTADLQEAFDKSKAEIIRLVKDGVKMFDPKLVTCLSTDFSKHGLGWILQQKTCGCRVISPICCESGWRLVLAGGRFTISAEERYSPTEGEALAVAVGLEGSKYYTLGCDKLLVATDHKPLVSILGDRAMDTIANPRLLRIKEKTLLWQFDIMYVPGSRQSAADALSRKKSLAGLHKLSVGSLSVEEDLYAAITSVTAELQLVTWEKLKRMTRDDAVLTVVMEMVERGFPDSQHDMPVETKKFHGFRRELLILDGVLCYKARVVVPCALRKEVLDTLHAAHQGISGMTSRAEQSVFWPGITEDIARKRATCRTCVRNAPSQPAGVPVAPPSPDYPHQMIVGDYCHLEGKNYLVMADRYSGWISIYGMKKGECDAAELIRCLKWHFSCFGVAEEFSSDGGPQFKSSKFQKFLKQYGVKHRDSSAYFPHSNSRAELAVKSAKRMLRDNVQVEGDLTSDRMLRALLQYRNTPHPDTRLSPAQVLYGRQIRDFFPVLNHKYEPKQEWGLIKEARELALSRRLDKDGARLAEHTKKLGELPVGTEVAVQNQTGRFPKKWDKSGVIVENQPYDKVLVRLDGSRNLTTRNRRFVRQIIAPVVPVVEHVMPRVSSPEVVAGDRSPSRSFDEEVAGTGPADRLDDVTDDGGEGQVDAEVPRVESDVAVATPPEMAVNTRPQRDRKPNVRYSNEEYDLTHIFVTADSGIVGKYVKI